MIVVMAFTARCEDADDLKLKAEIEAADRLCPVNMGVMGTMVGIKYDVQQKEVQMHFSLNDDLVKIDVLKENEQLIVRTIQLSFSKGESKGMLSQLVSADAGLSLTFDSASTGKSFTVKLSPEDIKDMYDRPMADDEINRLILQNQLVIENSRCPYAVADGMEMVRAYDDGDNIVYACRVDETMYDVATIERAKEEIKQDQRSFFDDPIMKRQLGIIRSLGKGFVYRYYGDTSGESADIVFTPDEIGLLLK